MGRFKQLLIRKERGWGPRESIKLLRETILLPDGQVLVPCLEIHMAISLSCFADNETPNRWEKLTVNWLMMVHCPQACRPQPGRLEAEGWWCWLPLSSSPAHQKNAMSWSCPFWTITIKLLTTRSRSGHSFEGLSPLWHPLPGQAIKLPFLPKTLSPKFNLVSEYRGHIWLQYN